MEFEPGAIQLQAEDGTMVTLDKLIKVRHVEEKYVHKNRISNEKLELEKEYQRIKDRKHEAYSYKYHLPEAYDMTFPHRLSYRYRP